MQNMLKSKKQLIEELQIAQEQTVRLKKLELKRKDMETNFKSTLHDLQVHQEELRAQNDELRKAREKLAISQRNYMYLFDFAPIGYFNIDQTSVITAVNLAGAEMLGYDRSHLIGKPLFLYTLPAARETLISHFREAHEKIHSTVEITLLNQDQQKFHVLFTSVLIKEKIHGNPSFLTTALDISEHKKGQEALIQARDSLAEKIEEATQDLLEEKHRIESVVETIPDGIVVFDIEGKIYMVNKVFKDFYKRIYNKELPIALKDFLILGHPFGETIAKLFYSKDKKPITIEPRKGIHFQLASSEVIIPPNNPLGVVISVRDVTPFVKLDQLRRQFITAVSHELRTPITAISQSIANFRKFKEKLSEEQKEKLISIVAASSSVLNQMIEDLLIVSRIEAKKFKIKPKNYLLWEVLNAVLMQMETSRQIKKISIQVDISPEIELFGDPVRIGQIFRILMDNAIKFSHENSSITIRATDNYQGEFNPKNVEGTLIQVIDTGIGIDELDLSQLFKPFFRSKLVKDIPGTGLGLSIAKELVLRHKGEIFVKSEWCKGSTFSVFLPQLEKYEEIT